MLVFAHHICRKAQLPEFSEEDVNTRSLVDDMEQVDILWDSVSVRRSSCP